MGWLGELVRLMGAKDVAIVMRGENLEQRLHASVLLAAPSALDDLEFRLSKCASLTGGEEVDIMPVRFGTECLRRVFPLLRSNRRNVHPTRCGVYYDMFYHHGSGTPNRGESSVRRMRADSYWGRVVPDEDLHPLKDMLMRDPEGFVSYLAGWSPGLYPAPRRREPSFAWERHGVSFRKVDESDLEELMRLKMEVWRCNHSMVFLNGRDQVAWLDGLRSRNPDDLVLAAVSDGRRFGFLKVLGIDWVSRSASIGWDVLDGFRGNGFGRRLVMAGVRFCVDILGLGSLDAEVLGSNGASMRCAEAAGFRRVGTRNRRVWKDGRFEDSVIFEFVKTGRQEDAIRHG